MKETVKFSLKLSLNFSVNFSLQENFTKFYNTIFNYTVLATWATMNSLCRYIRSTEQTPFRVCFWKTTIKCWANDLDVQLQWFPDCWSGGRDAARTISFRWNWWDLKINAQTSRTYTASTRNGWNRFNELDEVVTAETDLRTISLILWLIRSLIGSQYTHYAT